MPQLVAHGSLSLLCHAIFTCGSNGLVFGPRSDHCLCSDLLVPNQAGLDGHIHALWNSPGTILVSNTAFQACLAGEQLPRLFCAGSQLDLTKSLYSSYQVYL